MNASMPPAGPPQTPPGWYPDPGGLLLQRWWSGQGWTDRTQPLAQTPQAELAGICKTWLRNGGIIAATIVVAVVIIAAFPTPAPARPGHASPAR